MRFAYTAMQAYPQVNFRFTIIPSTNRRGGMVPLDFNRTVLESEITLGDQPNQHPTQPQSHGFREEGKSLQQGQSLWALS